MRTALETRVLDALARGPLTGRELAREIDAAYSTVRGVVGQLRSEGAVRVTKVRLNVGRTGQSAHVYALAPDGQA